jgi:RHS repeat-associated protein
MICLEEPRGMRHRSDKKPNAVSPCYDYLRYYDTTIGEFLSQDPLGYASGSTNLHEAFGDDPINNEDPSGLMFETGNDSGLQSFASDYGPSLNQYSQLSSQTLLSAIGDESQGETDAPLAESPDSNNLGLENYSIGLPGGAGDEAATPALAQYLGPLEAQALAGSHNAPGPFDDGVQEMQDTLTEAAYEQIQTRYAQQQAADAQTQAEINAADEQDLQLNSPDNDPVIQFASGALNNLSNAAVGIGSQIANVASTDFSALAHPINTIKTVAWGAENPGATFDALDQTKASFEESLLSNVGQTYSDLTSGNPYQTGSALATIGVAALSDGEDEEALSAYDVGTSDALLGRSIVGDDLVVHHVGQAYPLEELIPGYNRAYGPAISVPTAEHLQIPNLRGSINLTPRQVLANDIQNLRNYTNTPNSSLQELIQLNKQMYPGAFEK